MGIDPNRKKILILKSTNHFFLEFSPIASKVLYAELPGSYPSDPLRTNYRRLKRAIWPIADKTQKAGVE